jgi:PAS domain S-box-containing protein|uniref:PAS domain-containing protein n=1 Tax=Desulfobacca acetoxidans TaxID=60893 RepID=A0A7V6DPL1_9BACT
MGPHDFHDLPEGDGVLILSSQGVILAATLQAERLLRRRLTPGQTLALAEIFTPEHLSQAELAVQEALDAGTLRSNLLARLCPEREHVLYLKYSVAPLHGPANEIMGVVLTFHDDTLSRSWSAWSDFGPGVEPDAFFEHLDRGVFVVNDRWRITAFNRRAREITGFTREEAVGRFCWEVFQADRCKRGCFLRATLEDGASRRNQNVRIYTKSGEPLDLLVSTAAVKNKRQAIVGGVETFQSLGLALVEEEKPPVIPGDVEIIGLSSPMKRLLAMLPDVAASEATVVLEGESGTGKDLFARAIHLKSRRAKGPFVAFNCSALVETLIESELFGHVRGAFTGAVSHKVGRFELARGGTLFLDEIGDLKPELQAKLLRVLETRVFERVGSTTPIPLEARVIAATSRNLAQEVRRGRFRMDLLYRLRTVPFLLPPLRERKEDIPLLVNHFLARLNRIYRKNVRGVDPKVMTLLQQYSWPGNIRELERTLEHAFVFVKGAIISREHLPELRSPLSRPVAPQAAPEEEPSASEVLSIQKALRKARGKREAAARLLGISRSSLWRKMKDYGML